MSVNQIIAAGIYQMRLRLTTEKENMPDDALTRKEAEMGRMTRYVIGKDHEPVISSHGEWVTYREAIRALESVREEALAALQSAGEGLAFISDRVPTDLMITPDGETLEMVIVKLRD